MEPILNKVFNKGDSLVRLYAGISVKQYKLNILFNRLVVFKGTINATDNGEQSVVQLHVPENSQPRLEFRGLVSHFGPNGPTINGLSINVQWDGVGFVADEIASETMDAFLDMLPNMYGAGQKAFESLNLAELRKLAKDPALEAPSQWSAVPNDYYPVLSLAPNPLNEKQAVADSQLPIVFTALALNSKDQKYNLAYKMKIFQGQLSAFVEFIGQKGSPKAEPELLKVYDVTHLLDSTMPYFYFDYWVDAYSVDPGRPLEHVMLSPPFAYNSLISSGFISDTQVVFNIHFKQTYEGNTLTPISAHFGIMPVKKQSK